MPQQILIPKHLIELLYRQGGVGFALDLKGLEEILREALGSSPVRTSFGFEQIKSSLAVLLEPGLHRGDTDLFQAIAGELMLDLGLFPKVLVLSPCGLGQYGADELIAFEGDLLSHVFVHGLVLL